jgi:hypothetical protein
MNKKDKKDKLCGVCNKTVDKEGIQCEICEKWSHPACVDISKDVYDTISRNDQMHWYCMGCNAGASQMIKQLKKIEDRMETIEESFNKHKDDVKKESDKMERNVNKFKEDLRGEIERVSKQLQEVQKEVKAVKSNITEAVDQTLISSVKEQEKKWADVVTKNKEDVSKQLDIQLKTRANEVDKIQKQIETVKETQYEIQEKETRRNNIIMYRADESEADSAEGRRKEDLNFVLGLFSCINSGADDEDITKVNRLGRRIDGAKPRPLLVELGNRTAKNLIMENLNKLKDAPAKFKKVIVVHDMTKKEREECRTLVDEAKTKTAQETLGEWIYVVRGPPGQMKLIRVRKH